MYLNMDKKIINRAFLAVFYFNTEGDTYNIEVAKSRDKARSNFGHLKKIDPERLKKAFDKYCEYQKVAIDSYLKNDTVANKTPPPTAP
jgi:hypothetical protein